MKHNIQYIFNKFINKYLDIYNPNYNQTKVINKITTCRTKKQGIRIYKCNHCHKKIYTYNSCKDRHCPTCLEYKKEFWIENHKQDILNINYYHLVISIPKDLKSIFYYNQKTMYNQLFKISNEVTIEVIKQELNLDISTTSILHTWSQLANYHPHIHILLTGGGINKLGKWENIKDISHINQNLILNKIIKKLTIYIKTHELLYYGRYSYLKNKDNLTNYLDNIKKDKWNIHINKPYKSVLDIYEYFGKYAFRVCITNERIKNITDTHVTFTYKDKNNRDITKETTIKGEEFIRKFLMHSFLNHLSK